MKWAMGGIERAVIVYPTVLYHTQLCCVVLCARRGAERRGSVGSFAGAPEVCSVNEGGCSTVGSVRLSSHVSQSLYTSLVARQKEGYGTVTMGMGDRGGKGLGLLHKIGL